MTRSVDDIRVVERLAAQGLNQSAISRETGIPRSTINAWLRGRTPNRDRAAACFRCRRAAPVFCDFTASAYAYLLGLYLGDGCMAAFPREVFRLSIYLHARYRRIVAECEAALALVLPSSGVSVYRRRNEQMTEVASYSRHWPCLIPQHGQGRKHERRIVLTDWQRAIVDDYPGRLLRGLIHSDGYRGTNTIRHPKKTYHYPRYQFSNRSDDIRAIFCEYCDKLGIEWRQMNRWNISIARRESVAKLDRFVGPKQ
jgi:hypothetical protein